MSCTTSSIVVSGGIGGLGGAGGMRGMGGGMAGALGGGGARAEAGSRAEERPALLAGAMPWPGQLVAADPALNSTETLLRNIQGLLKVAADNARQQERQINYEKGQSHAIDRLYCA